MVPERQILILGLSTDSCHVGLHIASIKYHHEVANFFERSFIA